MGSVQRMATVVIVGLVALSTVLFLYLGDEGNRINAEAAEQQEVAITRGRETFISLCLPCHGPAGQGYTEPGVSGSGRIGAALGGVNTSLNQQGINSQGTPVAGGVAGRETILHSTIYNGLKNPDGTYRMPAFAASLGGPLNDEQINELVIFIQHGDWNETYNKAIVESGGYPTPPPGPCFSGDGAAPSGRILRQPVFPMQRWRSRGVAKHVTMHDIFFDPADLTAPADTAVTIDLVNEGAAVHDFTIDALGVSVMLNPGESGQVSINAPAGELRILLQHSGTQRRRHGRQTDGPVAVGPKGRATMGDLIRQLGDIRVSNLGENFGVLADTVEVVSAILLMVGGIFITFLIQRWADRAGEVQSAANVGRGGGLRAHEERGIRE